jgi:16S rRNA (guanine527-N7)-methyltransferase
MSQLSKLLKTLDLDLGFEAKLDGFVTLFEKWNARINLAASRTRDEIVEHVRDSLHVVQPLANRTRVLDVGSGGGFPVVIAAICLPASSFVALEPVHKKHAFLRTAARELALVNLEAHADRVEDHEGSDYDAATSRATMDLAEWLATGLTRVRPGGIVIGFEAQRRDDLPPTIQRLSYSLDTKQRALVILERPITP